MTSELHRALAMPPEALAREELEPIEVAVLDSGIDSSHPDLLGRVANAFLVDVADGRVILTERSLSENPDVLGHGTAVASIIAGVASNARLVDYRVLGSSNAGTGTAVVAALADAVRRRCRVINMSLAVTADFAAKLMPLCEQAYRQGQVVVAAKRNMPLVDFGFPAEFSSVISVDRDRLPSAYALAYRTGHPIEWVGRGDDVVVAATGGGYTTKTGTSFATPAITGICAVLLGRYPSLRPFEVKALLRAFAEER